MAYEYHKVLMWLRIRPYELLFVFDCPVNLVVVSGAQIDHDVFISEEKHY